MPLKVYNGSSWISATGLKVYDGSSWVSATNGKVWDGSSWVTFFNPVQVNVTDQYYFAGNGGYESAYAETIYGLSELGSAFYEITGDTSTGIQTIPGEWLVSGNGALVSVKATILSQSIGSESALIGTFDTFLPLTSTHDWKLYSSLGRFDSADSSEVTFRIDLVLTADTSVILDTATIQLSVQTQTA